MLANHFVVSLVNSLVLTNTTIDVSVVVSLVVPSLRGRPFNNALPRFAHIEWIAPNSVVIGDVRIGKGSSIWPGAIVRGDQTKIVIGNNVVIQDLTVVGTDSGLPKQMNPASKELQREGEGMIIIKDNVVVGPQCSIGMAKLESYAYVADKAAVSDGCVIEEYGVLAGGSYLEPGKTIPSSQVWAGNPAKYLRDVTVEEKITMVENAKQLVDLSKIYAEETEKTPREVFDDKCDWIFKSDLSRIEILSEQMWQKGYPYTYEDYEEIDKRVSGSSSVISSGVGDTIEDNFATAIHEDKDYFEKGWESLSFDDAKMSTLLKQYGVNTDMYEKAYQRFKNEPTGLEREDESLDDIIPKDQGPWEKKYENIRREDPPTIS